VSSNVEAIREGYAAFGRGDIPAVLAILDPNIEWIEPEGYPWGDTFHGHDEVVGLFQTAAETLGPDWRVEPDRFIGTDDGVLVMGRHTGRRVDGVTWEVPFAMVWTMEDGRATHFRQYGDSALLREAVGPSTPAPPSEAREGA
jgi:ketosteroid isomerase-like protein